MFKEERDLFYPSFLESTACGGMEGRTVKIELTQGTCWKAMAVATVWERHYGPLSQGGGSWAGEEHEDERHFRGRFNRT